MYFSEILYVFFLFRASHFIHYIRLRVWRTLLRTCCLVIRLAVSLVNCVAISRTALFRTHSLRQSSVYQPKTSVRADLDDVEVSMPRSAQRQQ